MKEQTYNRINNNKYNVIINVRSPFGNYTIDVINIGPSKMNRVLEHVSDHFFDYHKILYEGEKDGKEYIYLDLIFKDKSKYNSMEEDPQG